jgi:hypothetical protein
MKYRLLMILLVAAVTAFKEKDEWTPLLDKDLSQWDMYLSYRHARDYKGDLPVGAVRGCHPAGGLQQNEKQVFSVIEEAGQPVLKVSGEIYGSVFTKKQYENYHLKLKVKWGDTKYEPRTDKLRDSGLLYHSVGENGVDYWRAWKLSQEFQIMEGTHGRLLERGDVGH